MSEQNQAEQVELKVINELVYESPNVIVRSPNFAGDCDSYDPNSHACTECSDVETRTAKGERYDIYLGDEEDKVAGSFPYGPDHTLIFTRMTPKGLVQGLTNEVLLTILLHRTKVLNEKCHCTENDNAIELMQLALNQFNMRTERVAAERLVQKK